jgi:DNA-binding PadR family transcriptional regulator
MKQIDLKILKALAAAGPPHEMSTFQLQQNISPFSDRKWLSMLDVNISSVYRAGERLEWAGLIERFSAPGGLERGFRDRLMYRATEAGLKASEANLEEGFWDRYFVPLFMKGMDRKSL